MVNKITSILKNYTKKHNIMASTVILEEYAEELVKNGVTIEITEENNKEFKSSKLIKSKPLYDFILPLLTKDNDTGYYIFKHPRGKVYITFYDGYIEEFENYDAFRKADLYE